MNTALKFALAFALLAVCVGLALFLWWSPSSSSLALEPGRQAEKPLEPQRDVPVDAQVSISAEKPDTARASLPGEAKAELAKPVALQAEAQVVAHIVDEQLRPIANAWLRYDAGEARTEKPVEEARTGRDGIATLPLKGAMAGQPLRFAAGADGYGSVFPRGTVKAGETLHLGDLTLRPGGAVRGRVVDKDQRPVAGAPVCVSDEHQLWGSNDVEQLRSRGPSTWVGMPHSKSGDDGSFLVEGVVAGMTRAWARSEGMRWSVSEPLEVVAGNEVRDVVLVLEAEGQTDPELRDIEGIVVGPDDKPIPSAHMQVRQASGNSSWGTSVNAEKDGRFRVHPRDRGVKITLDFSDPAERYTGQRLDDVKPGTKDLVVRLEEPRSILLSARDERGPVEKFRVRWGINDGDSRGFVDKDEPHADGRALLRVPTSAEFRLSVLAPGHIPEQLGPLDARKLPAELAVALKTIPGIHGRVVAGDKPVPGAKVALFEQPQDSEIEMNGFTTLVQTEAETEATSDAQGEFTLDLQKDGHFSIFAEAAGYARAQVGPARYEASKGQQGLVIQLDAGGTLEGKVLMPAGRSPAGVIVAINRGDARPQTQSVGPDGAFRFERLTAGAWELKRCDEMFHGPTSTSISSGGSTQAREVRHDFTIAVGQTTRMDLDLRDAEPCVLEIELSNNGQPARAWSIVGWPKDRHTFTGSPPSAATDSNGRARLELEEPGECTLTIAPPPESGSELKVRVDVTLRRGSNPWSQDVRTGRIEGTIAGWQPDPALHWSLGQAGQQEYERIQIRPDASGHFVVPFVAAGRIEVKRYQGLGQEQTREVVQTFDLAAGETKTLQL